MTGKNQRRYKSLKIWQDSKKSGTGLLSQTQKKTQITVIPENITPHLLKAITTELRRWVSATLNVKASMHSHKKYKKIKEIWLLKKKTTVI